MGTTFSVTKKLGLDCVDDFIRYVLNDCSCHSECFNCCTFDVETHPVELSSNAVDVDLSTDGLHLHT